MVDKTGLETTTEFLWQGDNLIAEMTNSEQYQSYVYEPGTFRPLALLKGEGKDAKVYHYHLDQIGTPLDITTPQGDTVWSVQYRAYGNVFKKTVAEIDSPLRFQGQYFDAETGLHYNRHRYYNPSAGRFITIDPIGLAGGLNNYQYVPNPTGWVDPLGLNNVPGKVPCKDSSEEQAPEPKADEVENPESDVLNSGVFPKTADEMSTLIGAPSKVGITPDGTVRTTWIPNSSTKIRHESHPHGLKPDDPDYNHRHHGEHFHVETKPHDLSWNQAKNKG
ncbi:MAG: RHS repeat-associated core domain-containing protein [Vibrio sp.]